MSYELAPHTINLWWEDEETRNLSQCSWNAWEPTCITVSVRK